MIRAYIDIDGVLIRSGKAGPELIPRFPRIMKYLMKNFDCFWLTTHVRSEVGSGGAVRKLAPYLKKSHVDLSILDGIKSTDWRTLKTEAIEFDQPFVWLDDNLLTAERQICEDKKCLDSVVAIDWEKRASRLTVRRLKRIRREAMIRLRSRSSRGARS